MTSEHKPQRLLVTGGAGFIGTNFVHYWLASYPDTRIVVLDALTYAGRYENLQILEGQTNFRFVHGDILDQPLVEQLLREENIDTIVHFAAESHNDKALSNPELFFDVNLGGTINIIQACVRHNKRVHHISTDEVYGDLAIGSQEKFTELSPYKPSNPYSASKAASDHAVRAWVRSFGLQATISNCSNNYGPRQHKEKLIPSAILRLRSGEPPILYGNGHNIRDWIHVDDHIDAIWMIIDRGAIGETYLIGSDDERSNLSVLSLLLEYFNKPPGFVTITDDRPGHDLRYALDASKLMQETGWFPKRPKLGESLPEMLRLEIV
jgi:dTDP-glucose 4,6-dehydratase